MLISVCINVLYVRLAEWITRLASVTTVVGSTPG